MSRHTPGFTTDRISHYRQNYLLLSKIGNSILNKQQPSLRNCFHYDAAFMLTLLFVLITITWLLNFKTHIVSVTHPVMNCMHTKSLFDKSVQFKDYSFVKANPLYWVLNAATITLEKKLDQGQILLYISSLHCNCKLIWIVYI